MKIRVPSYYKKFKCIADKCRHSCCIGWEIDIDPDAMDRYMSVDGDIGKMLRDNISKGKEPHFLLKEGDRCPFLKDNGLCHLICELGEEYLCNICADHPRFRNFFAGGVEIGLGLCCEEAAQLILKCDDPFETEGDEDIYSSEEMLCINKRTKLISLLQDIDSVTLAFDEVLKEADTSFPKISLDELVDFLMDLERLDPEWTEVLISLKNTDIHSFADPDEIIESRKLIKNLAIYLLYRHMPAMVYDGDMTSKIRFALVGALFIHTLAAVLGKEYISYEEAFCDYARMFSGEIEYSDENLNDFFDELMFS